MTASDNKNQHQKNTMITFIHLYSPEGMQAVDDFWCILLIKDIGHIRIEHLLMKLDVIPKVKFKTR